MSVAARRRFTTSYLYAAVVLCLGLGAASAGLFSWSTIPLLVIGLFSWSVFEYVMHRFIFHYDAQSRLGRKFLYHAHISHHEDPVGKKWAFLEPNLGLPISVRVLAAGVGGDRFLGGGLDVHRTGGRFLQLQMGSFQCHHRKAVWRLLKYLRHYHLLHHYKTPDCSSVLPLHCLILSSALSRPFATARVFNITARPE